MPLGGCYLGASWRVARVPCGAHALPGTGCRAAMLVVLPYMGVPFVLTAPRVDPVTVR